jgi:predicted secreted protein|tara:strand:+ start:2315 stop:2758 length:444 start_codon:yes stop_codon:yes gene_type:complete
MAAQDGQLNGTELGVYVGGVLVAYSTNATLNVNHSTRSTTSKESGGWEDNMEGLRNWDVSCDALYAWLDPAGTAISNKTLSDLFTGYLATRTSFDLTFGNTSATAGNTKYTGTAWLTSASLTAPLEDTSTFSVSFQGSGPLVQAIAV